MASYYVWSGAAGSANGSSWANAYTTLTTALSGKAGGDVFYVSHDHAQSTAGAVTITSPAPSASNPIKVICVNRAGSVPPVSADRRATATVTTTGNASITLQESAHYDGITFIAGSTGTTANISLNSNNAWYRLDNCSLQLAGGGTSNKIFLGNIGVLAEFNNTTASFANVTQSIGLSGVLKWRNTPSALLGTIPTSLFTNAAFAGGDIECIGVDLSAAGSGKTIVNATGSGISVVYKFIDCKLDAAVTKASVPSDSAVMADFIRSGATGNYAVHRARYPGTLTEETTIVRTGGATDGTTPISWKIVTNSKSYYSQPFECPPIAIWCDTTGSAKTATVEGIWGGGAVPNDDDVWIDVEYLGSSSSPQGSFVNDGKADLLATAAAQTSSSATWGGSTTKFKLNVTFTPQQKGWVYARVKCAKVSSTFYIDPLITLT